MSVDRFEPKDHMNCSKLSILIEKDCGLQNSVKVLKIHQVAIWSGMELFYK